MNYDGAENVGAPSPIRTDRLLLTMQLLGQLSFRGSVARRYSRLAGHAAT
jgi:hypothetical protein